MVSRGVGGVRVGGVVRAGRMAVPIGRRRGGPGRAARAGWEPPTGGGRVRVASAWADRGRGGEGRACAVGEKWGADNERLDARRAPPRSQTSPRNTSPLSARRVHTRRPATTSPDKNSFPFLFFVFAFAHLFFWDGGGKCRFFFSLSPTQSLSPFFFWAGRVSLLSFRFGGWGRKGGARAGRPGPARQAGGKPTRGCGRPTRLRPRTHARAPPPSLLWVVFVCVPALSPSPHSTPPKKKRSFHQPLAGPSGGSAFLFTHAWGGGEVARAPRRARGVVAAAIRQHSPNGVVAAGGGARPERGTGEGGRTNTHRPAAMSPVRAPARAPPQGWDERGQRHRGGRGRVVVRAARPAHALPSPGARTHTHTHTHTRRRRVLASPRLLGRNGGKDGAPHKAGPQGGAGRAGGV